MLIPEIRAWTKVDEIESIQYDMTFGHWQEVGSAPKWDPRNRETPDHSLPYLLARALIDGEIYLDSFTPEKYPFRDPVVKALMDKMTLSPFAGWNGLGTARVFIRKNTGEARSWDTMGGSKNPRLEDYRRLMTDEDITNKFIRASAYKKVTNAQRDQALAQWSNILAIKDIAEPMRTLATFGNPLPL